MSQKLNRVPGGPAFRLVILALAILGLGLAGCSEDLPTQAPVDSTTSTTGVFHVNSVDDNVNFEFISSKNGDPEDPIEGPFAIRGRNIRYDAENSMLIVDLSVENMGENTFDEGVTLTFLSLLPEGVTVLNPDNNENGNGAAINFEFENDDGQWTPGEESLLRETHFGVDEGVSIGFVARLDTGTGSGMGSIGGMVWNDENGDGIMDEGEAGVEGATLELSAEGMEAVTTLSGADGTYSFDDLASGFYMVVKKPTEGMVATTSPRIYVILVAEDGTVSSFLAANFGCMKDTGGGGSAVISGLVWNDLNGDGKPDEGEPALEGVEVNLSGDATETMTTAADGTYAFTELTAGEYKIASVGPDGWVLTTASPISVMLGTDDAVFDLGIFGWTEDGTGGGNGVISGLVWNDLNGDGKPDEGETGLEGVEVNLSGEATDTTTTAADGTYAFTELTAGEYKIASVGPDGWVLTTASPISVMLGTDDAVFDLGIFGWTEDGTGGGKASIGGVVFSDLNGNKVQDVDEPGLEGLKVALDGTASLMATTDAEGAYMFDELGMGEYKVRSTGPDAWVSTTGEELTIKIETEDQIVDNAHFGWMEDSSGGGTAVIKGVVWNDLNGDGKKTEDEPGLVGTKVDLAGDATATMVSGVDGIFTFTELMAGTYTVTSNGPEGFVSTTDEALTIVLATDDEVNNGSVFGWMEDSSGGGKAAIGGYVFNDLNGNKVMDEDEPIFGGVTVTLSGDATATMTTSDKGLYAFIGLVAGNYEVTCSPVDGHTSTTGAVLVVKVPTDLDVIDGVNFGWIKGEGLLQ